MLEFDPPIVLENEFTQLMNKIVRSVNLAYKACYSSNENICALRIDGI